MALSLAVAWLGRVPKPDAIGNEHDAGDHGEKGERGDDDDERMVLGFMHSPEQANGHSRPPRSHSAPVEISQTDSLQPLGGMISIDVMRKLTTSDWERLRTLMHQALPFPPPFQRKDIGSSEPEPPTFDEDVWYHGDCGEGLDPLGTIEWIRIRPRYLRVKGQLVPPEVIDCEAELTALLARERFDFVTEPGCIMLYGAATGR